jgi:purine-binding chemotaxis protein CheW
MLRFRRKKVTTEESVSRRFVVFTSGGKDFGIDIGMVKEAIRMGKVISVPKAPVWIKGVMELRGKVIPIVDLARRLELQSAGGDEGTVPKGILVSIGEQTVGLGIDEVHEVIELDDKAISAPDGMLSAGVGEGYLDGVGKTPGGLLLLLNVEKLFTSQERDALSTVGGGKDRKGAKAAG